MNNTKPLVAVVIPALNCEDEVDECVEALRAQDYPAGQIEIIVGDNGSTDRTVQRLQRLGIRVVSEPDRGRSKALNAALRATAAEFVLTTDMSCRPRHDWVSTVLACFEDPDVGCVAGEIKLVHSFDNLALRYQARNDYMSPLASMSRRQLPFLPYADGANASFRSAVFEEIGGFEASFYKAADVEICYRLLVLSDYKIAFCPDCVVDEPGEPDLKALMRQRYRIGLGSHLLRARFPEFYASPESRTSWKERYWSAREKLTALARFGADLARLDRPAVEDAIVRFAMGVAQDFGKRKGKRFLQDQRVQPVAVDAARLRQFANELSSLDDRVVLRRVEALHSADN